jgi:hypothetical protein
MVSWEEVGEGGDPSRPRGWVVEEERCGVGISYASSFPWRPVPEWEGVVAWSGLMLHIYLLDFTRLEGYIARIALMRGMKGISDSFNENKWVDDVRKGGS